MDVFSYWKYTAEICCFADYFLVLGVFLKSFQTTLFGAGEVAQ